MEAQVARLGRMFPDIYRIEERPTTAALRRMIEIFEELRPGDELCIASLATLNLDAGEAAQMLLALVDRGVRLRLASEGDDFDIAGPGPSRRLLEMLAALHRRRQQDPPPKGAADTPQLLTEAEIADIRRLSRAGLSPRRIGLIYRRSPRCITEVLWKASNAAGVSTAQMSA